MVPQSITAATRQLLAFARPPCRACARRRRPRPPRANAWPRRQPSARPAPHDTSDVDAWLDGYMPYAMETGDIAGAVVVVVKDGQVLTERGFGYADVAKRMPVDPSATLFRPGSVSKLFTWTAVMQLVEQGKLDLDADVNTYLDFKIPAARRQARSRCATS